MTRVLSRLNIKIIGSGLPPLPNDSKDLLKYYKEGLKYFYDELITNKDISLEDFAQNQFNDWFRNVDKLNNSSIKRLIEDNKDKIYNKAKRDFNEFKLKGNALDLVFWYVAYNWYKSQESKLASQKKKEEELERKRKAQEEKEAKKKEKTQYIETKDIFDKSKNDVVWQFLQDYKQKTIEYLSNIKKEYLKLDKNNRYYYDLLNKEGMRAYSELGDEKAAYLHQRFNYALDDIKLALQDINKIIKVINYDIDVKYAEFVKRIYQKLKNNKITDIDLHIGKDGNINGYIYYDGGKIKVETILAWGEVYRPHYRVLVK